MLLPTTATAVLVALIISLIGWGSWASLFKMAKKARFELFYYDFNWGALAAAILLVFTLGMWDQKELTFQDNFILTGYRKIAWALGSGILLNLATVLLLAAVSVSGMTVTFPIAFSIAWAIAAGWQYFAQPGVNPLLAFGGAGVTLLAGLLAVIAYRWHRAGIALSAETALRADPRVKATAPPKTGTVGIILASVAGVFYSLFFPVLGEAMFGDNGLASYGAVLLAVIGLFASSVMIVPFFLNFPVQGGPLEVRRYFKMPLMHHLLGVLAGVVFVGGLLSGLVILGIPPAIQISPVISFLLSHSGPLVAALWGLLIWREFAGAPTRVTMMLAAMFVMLLAGLGIIAVAPGFGK
ncbi:MAG: hypothetical protein ABI811_20245 [Acidobacteriota bacterium]